MLVLPSAPDRGSDTAVSCGPDGVVGTLVPEVAGTDVVVRGTTVAVVVLAPSEVDVVALGGDWAVVGVDAF